MDVVLPSGATTRCSELLADVPIGIEGYFFPGILVCFPLSDFDVILGMDWLKRYKANLDCEEEKIHLRTSDGARSHIAGILLNLPLELFHLVNSIH